MMASMSEVIELGDIRISLTRKRVKNVHLTVHPPDGRVTLVVPHATRTEVARAYAISRLGWIRQQRTDLKAQAREEPRQHVTRETHYVWGRRYLMRVHEVDAKPQVTLDHRHITLQVRPGSSAQKRAEVVHEWHKALLHAVVPALTERWAKRLGVTLSGYFLQRMKTQWGSCNPHLRNIRLNTELVKKPKDLLEYVIVHELAHLLEPTHSERFVMVLDQHFPQWREARAELNALPLAAGR
jgi:predicted metal-dependent hydrolase